MTDTILERRHPEASTLPRIDCAQLPTPVEHLERLGAEIGIPRLFVKRDDQSGTLYGGNKVRKLEYLLGEALEEGHREVWTVGAIGSHHVLATCIYARQQGLEPAALHFPQEVTDHVLDNLRALSTTRPKLTLVGNKAQIPIEVLRTKVREWLARGPDVYYIPGGGSSAVGALGYVNAVLEIEAQVEAGEMPEPDYIFSAAGTCGTVAGLALGCQMSDMEARPVGVRVLDRVLSNSATIVKLCRQMASLLREHGVEDVPKVGPGDFELLHDYFGDAYGVPTDAGRRAIRLADTHADLTLEPTYTGKAFAGLIGARDAFDLDDATVLYCHTLNGVDLSDRIDRANVDSDLPDEYRQFFR
jgi:D-cysteine desulfhydrase